MKLSFTINHYTFLKCKMSFLRCTITGYSGEEKQNADN